MAISTQSKTALVTGAGSGIGRALAAELVRRGYRVVVSDVDIASATRTASEIGIGADPAHLDVRDAAAFKKLVEHLEAEHDGLDMLVNNAGIPISGEVHDLVPAHWDRIIDINLRGVVHGICAAYPSMQKRRRGTIVNVASIAGLVPSPLGVPYATTKHAVVGLSTSLRAEAATYGVKVCTLCPAAVDTPILDRDNPADLPSTGTYQNNRNYLTRLTGRPIPVDVFARRSLDAVAKNKGIFVTPALAVLAWQISHHLPTLTRWRLDKVLADCRPVRRP